MYGDSYGRTRSKKPLFIGIGVLLVVGIIVALVIALISNSGEKKEISHDLVELQGTIMEYKEYVEYYEDAFDRAFDGYRIYQPEQTAAFYEKEKEALSSNLTKYEEFRNKLDNFAEIKAIDTTGKEVSVDSALTELKRTIDKRMTFYKEFKEINTLVLDAYINNGDEATLSSLKSHSNDKDYQQFAKSLEKYFESRKPIEAKLKNNSCDSNKKSNTCINSNRELLELRSNYMKNDIESIKKVFSALSINSKTENSPAVLADQILRMDVVVKEEE